MASDTDELDRLKEALRLSEERFHMVSQATDDTTWDWDLTTGRLWWGENLYKTFLYQPEEIEADITSWTTRIHPDDVDRVTSFIHQCIDRGDKHWTDEYRFLCKDGTYRNILDRGFIQHDGDGTPIRMVGAMVDVTARKRVEAERKHINEELEKRVVLRTAEIAAARDALEAFSYSVSHDLRGPLRHITGFLQLLARTNIQRLDEDGKRYLGITLEAAQKMAQLIEALLSFSHLGQSVMRIQRVDMGSLVAEILQSLRQELQGRNIEWTVHPLPTVDADATLLKQVLVNLIDNAVKYTRLQAVAKIEIGSTKDPEGTVFFVKDNGVGFDMKYAGKLFNVFQRLHKESEFEGDGIGLANVKRIVLRHGGRVWTDSKEGAGATFYFLLPSQIREPGGATIH